jgi:hypothetical protein
MGRFSLLLCVLVALLAGCGSSSKQSSSPPPPTILPPADSEQQWASRVVDLFLRPLNKDLQVVNGLRDPNVVIYLSSGNKTTTKVVNNALDDLQQCQNKLRAIGPPPPQSGRFQKVNNHFKAACANYVPTAKTLKKAVFYWSSGRSDVISQGFKIFRSTIKDANAAGNQYVAGIRIAQDLPEFRRAGLKPSA